MSCLADDSWLEAARQTCCSSYWLVISGFFRQTLLLKLLLTVELLIMEENQAEAYDNKERKLYIVLEQALP